MHNELSLQFSSLWWFRESLCGGAGADLGAFIVFLMSAAAGSSFFGFIRSAENWFLGKKSYRAYLQILQPNTGFGGKLVVMVTHHTPYFLTWENHRELR